MKVRLNSIPSKIGKSIFLAVVLTIFSMSPAFAGGDVFQVGKKYQIVSASMGGDGKILILEKPDKNGWVKVKALTKGIIKYIGDEGFVNLSNYILAKEIKQP